MYINKNKCHGFSLIELLVVISIIAILSSLLMPALHKTINSAKQLSCSNNLKQVGLKVQLYSEDNKGYGPSNEYYGATALLEGYTAEQVANNNRLADVDGIKGIYLCPATETVIGCGSYRTSYSFTGSNFSSAGNYGGYYYHNSAGVATLRRLHKMPVNSVLMIESRLYNVWSDIACANASYNAKPSYTNNFLMYLNAPEEKVCTWFYNHDGYANFIFPDQHIKSYQENTMFGEALNNHWKPLE